MPEIKKILFITLSNIGDVILTLPALDMLINEYPQSRITVIAGPRPQELFRDNPRVHNLVVYDKHSSLKDKIGLFRKLKQERFDLVVDLRNTFYGRFLPVQYRILPRRGRNQHMKDKHLAAVSKFLGKNFSRDIAGNSLYISEEEKAYVDKLLKENGLTDNDRIVAVSPGARSHTKRWGEEGFREVCEALVKGFGVKIILVGDKEDSLIARRIMAVAPGKITDFTGKTSLKQLAALLKKTSMLITNDSAVLHMASYLNIPVVALFGPTSERKYAPWSQNQAVVKKDIFCRPCQKAQCVFGSFWCMHVIRSEDVLRAAGNILSPGSNPPTPDPKFKRILIARTDRLGDVLLSTPVIKALREAYPCAYIAMVVSPYTKEAVEGNPYLDEVLVYDKHCAHKGCSGGRGFASELKKRKFDLALILHPMNRIHVVTFFAGIPKRVGFNNKLGFLLTDKLSHTKHTGEKHEMEYSLDFVRYLGIEPKDKSLYMPIKKESEMWADKIMEENEVTKDNRLVVIHPAASCPSKVWPQERFAETANQLVLNHRARIAIVSGESDIPIAKKVIQGIHSAVIDLSGKTSISQLASLLKRAHLFISNDSGPVHVASAVGTPVISIFGRSQLGLGPKRWGPVGIKDRFLHKPAGCIECLAHNCVKDFVCLKAITVDDVMKVADEILKS